MQLSLAKRFLLLFLGLPFLGFAYNCRLKLEANFTIQTIDDVKKLLADIRELDFVEQKRDIHIIAQHLLEAPIEVKKETIPLLLEKLREKADQHDQVAGFTEKRVLQRLLAKLHSPYDLYKKGEDGKLFLDSFLQTRQSRYTSNDIILLAKVFQDKMKTARAKGERVDRIVLAGSVAGGTARLPGSDIDFMVYPPEAKLPGSTFGSENWGAGMSESLKEANSPLAQLNFKKSTALHPTYMSYMAESSKLMIEIKQDEVTLILIPIHMTGVLEFQDLEQRVPLLR